MIFRARLLVLGLLLPSCFSPDAPAETDGGGTNDAPSSGGSTDAGVTEPTGTSPTMGMDSSTSESPTGSGTALTETSPTETSPTDTDPSATEGGDDCGNGEVDAREACDDGVNDGGYGGCNSDCTFAAFCGDGQVQEAEACDDGDEVEGNGCNTNCLESGTELWTHQVHSGTSDVCRVVRADGDHVFLGGNLPNPAGGNGDDLFWAQRLDGAGNVAWTAEYGPYTADEENYILVGGGLEQGAFVLAGALQFQGGLDQSSLFAAFSREDGSLSWSRDDEFGASRSVAIAFAGSPDEAGGLGVAQTSSEPSVVVSLSATGTIGSELDLTNEVVAVEIAGGNVISGEVVPPGSGSVIIFRNAGLGPLWQAQPAGLNNVSGVASTPAGEVYAAGGYRALGFDLNSGWLVKFDGSGDELWRLEAAELGADIYSVVAAPDGAALVVGRSSGAPWMARVSADGVVLWEYDFSGQGVLVSGALGEGPEGPYFLGCGVAEAGGADGDNILAIAVTP